MGRSFYILAFLLITLVLPIIMLALPVPYLQSLGQIGYILTIVFGLGLSGPGLVLYSLLVYHFSEVKEKKFLCAVALLIGLPWTLCMMYMSASNID